MSIFINKDTRIITQGSSGMTGQTIYVDAGAHIVA